MKKLLLIGFAGLCVAAINRPAMAYGPHDENCKDCHSVHAAKGDDLRGVNPSLDKYPKSGEAVKGTDSFCLGCHNKAAGIMPVDLQKTHPLGIAPKKAKVPAANLSTAGTLGCMGCHDPHPSNPNYKYLVMDTQGGKNMGKFCNYCHPAQAAQARPEGVAPVRKPAPKAAPAPKKG